MVQTKARILHIYGDLIGCCPEKLSDARFIENALEKVCEEAGLEVIDIYSHKFGGGGGVSLVAIIKDESHIGIHTWPEYCFATLDIYVTSPKCDLLETFVKIVEVLECRRYILHFVDRTLLP